MALFIQQDLGQRVEFSDKEQQWFRLLKGNVDAVGRLVDGLHQYLSVDGGKPVTAPVPLGPLLSQVDTRIRDTMARHYSLEIGDMPTVAGNEAQLFMVFQNLIGNAIKYNDKPPEIRLSCQRDDARQQCHVAVEDNGIGIEAPYLKRIFQPFERLHAAQEYAGSGLGLSIVKRLVERHGGTITVASTPGKGTCFTVTLPLA